MSSQPNALTVRRSPALITTVVINAGDRLIVNALGWLDISVGKASVA